MECRVWSNVAETGRLEDIGCWEGGGALSGVENE